MIKIFEINRENSRLLTLNDDIQYVHGIGDTDYTVHREANDIFKHYKNEFGHFIGNTHTYHVFVEHLTKILDDSKFKSEIIFDNKKYKVNKVEIGIPEKTILSLKREYKNRLILISDGILLDELTNNDRIVYIVDLTEINIREQLFDLVINKMAQSERKDWIYEHVNTDIIKMIIEDMDTNQIINNLKQ